MSAVKNPNPWYAYQDPATAEWRRNDPAKVELELHHCQGGRLGSLGLFNDLAGAVAEIQRIQAEYEKWEELPFEIRHAENDRRNFLSEPKGGDLHFGNWEAAELLVVDHANGSQWQMPLNMGYEDPVNWEEIPHPTAERDMAILDAEFPGWVDADPEAIDAFWEGRK